MKYRKSHALVSGLILLSLVLSMTACSTGTNDEQPTPTPLPTSIVPSKPTFVVQSGDIVREYQFTGRVSPVVEEEIFFRSGGRVRNVYFDEGQAVAAGDVSADLDFLDDLERQLTLDELRLRRSEIQVENAQLSLELFIMNTPSAAEVQALAQQALANAELAVQAAERAYNNTHSTATQAEIDSAYASLILAERAWQNAETAFEPYANKPADDPARAQAQSQLSSAKASYDAQLSRYNATLGVANQFEQSIAEAQLALAEAQLADAQAEWDRVQEDPTPQGYNQQLILKQNELELVQISYQETQVSVADIENSIADAQIVAPFDGEIRNVSTAPGRSVDAFKPVVLVADMSAIEISANLSSDEVEELLEGMLVEATVSNRPGETFTGVIRRLPYFAGGSGAIDDIDQTTRITLDVSPEELNLDVGDLMRINVVLEEKVGVLWLPPQAIRNFEGRRFVVVQADGVQQRVDIVIGVDGDDRIEVEEGLEEGMIVVGP
jgi:RND family efflux transporter MFP subunit